MRGWSALLDWSTFRHYVLWEQMQEIAISNHPPPLRHLYRRARELLHA